MSWVDDMKRDAVAIAFPDWELRDDDEIEVNQHFDDGWDPTYSEGPAQFDTEVFVQRAGVKWGGAEWRRSHMYFNQDAQDFWIELMKKGSER